MSLILFNSNLQKLHTSFYKKKFFIDLNNIKNLQRKLLHQVEKRLRLLKMNDIQLSVYIIYKL